jgi:carbamate kinase
MTAKEARTMLEAGEFGAGSMGPKVEAAVRFVEQGGGARSVIGDLDAAIAVLAGESGTSIVAD